MTRVYYSCHHHRSGSVSVHYEERPDGAELKKGFFRHSKGSAKKTLKKLANAQTVKWDYEEQEGRLRDPGQIARFIFEGYRVKHQVRLKRSLSAKCLDKLCRLVHKVTRTQTKLQQHAALVEAIEKKQYTFKETKKLRLERSYDAAKASAERAIEASERLLREFERIIALRIEKAEGRVLELKEKIKGLKSAGKLLEEKLEKAKATFINQFCKKKHRHLNVLHSIEVWWEKHIQKKSEVKLLVAQIEENRHELATIREEYRQAKQKPAELLDEKERRLGEMRSAHERLREEIGLINDAKTEGKIMRIAGAAELALAAVGAVFQQEECDGPSLSFAKKEVNRNLGLVHQAFTVHALQGV